MLGRLLVHVSNYSIGSLLIALAGFLSFPVLTRVFSVADYGVMSLVSTTLTLLTAFGKLGQQQSIVRFYAEIRAGKRDVTERQYVSTVVLGMAITGTVVALLWAIASQIIPAAWWDDARVRPLLLLTAALIFVRTIDSGLINLLRARQHSAWYSVYTVSRRYGSLAIILGTVVFVMRDLTGLYVATLVSEAGATAILAWLILRTTPVSRAAFDVPLFRAMIAFGVPMIAYEFAGMVLNVGDRYVIQWKLGAEPLGVYSAAYNMCEYVQSILVMSLGQAVTPMYMRLWEEKGPAATRQFVERALHFFVMISAAVIAGVAAVGEDVLVLLASDKYRAGAVVIPWVIAGMAIDGGIPLFGAGIFIKKRTRTLMGLVVASAVFNIALNIVLVPKVGLVGAAAATLIAYSVLTLAVIVVSARELPLRMPIVEALKFAVLAAIMYFVVRRIEVPRAGLELIVRVAAGFVVYALLVFVFDRAARSMFGRLWAHGVAQRAS